MRNWYNADWFAILETVRVTNLGTRMGRQASLFDAVYLPLHRPDRP